MPLCLRFGGGGVASANGEPSSSSCCCDHRCKNKDPHNPTQVILDESARKDNGCDTHRTINIFNALRRKWRRRNKRKDRCDTRKCSCDTPVNVCQCSNGDGARDFCVKHQRLKPWGSGTEISKTAAVGVDPGEQGGVRDYDNVAAARNEALVDDSNECSCFGSPSRRALNSVTAKVVKLKAAASRSLSDISNTANISSLTHKTDSESDLTRIAPSVDHNDSENLRSYSNGLCTESIENVALTCGMEESASHYTIHPGQKIGNLTQELYKLSKYGWYWGPINRSEAESKLVDQPDGAFLVRDSSDDRYILSLSFRSYGKTLHTRIEHSNGLFSFYSQPEPEGHASIVELINQSMCYSQSGVFCYSRSRSPGSPSFPVRLTKPISRFTQVRSLQYLCRFVIRQFTRFDHIQKLPLPERIKGYLEEGHY